MALFDLSGVAAAIDRLTVAVKELAMAVRGPEAEIHQSRLADGQDDQVSYMTNEASMRRALAERFEGLADLPLQAKVQIEREEKER